MKKIDVNMFILKMKEELDSFESYQLTYSASSEKTTDEWVSDFMVFAGHEDADIQDQFEEEYDDELYYGQDLQYEELVNRRKYRSFRDDDSY